MTTRLEVYKCNICGNIVEVLHAGGPAMVCCKEKMQLLEEKTAGNLNNEEKNLLKNILYDLRLMYVKEKG